MKYKIPKRYQPGSSASNDPKTPDFALIRPGKENNGNVGTPVNVAINQHRAPVR